VYIKRTGKPVIRVEIRNQRAGNRNQKGTRGQKTGIRIQNRNQRTGRLRGQDQTARKSILERGTGIRGQETESEDKDYQSREKERNFFEQGNRNQRPGNRNQRRGKMNR
jgi:hypothetical protein